MYRTWMIEEEEDEDDFLEPLIGYVVWMLQADTKEGSCFQGCEDSR
jgi:hypothetical protein